MAVVWMAGALAFTTFVIDLGHWFEHKRHLQLQADAGAFAGGGLFNKCIAASAADRAAAGSAANTAIEDEARRYAGDTTTFPTAHNPQVTNRDNVTVLLNSTTYANRGGANNSDPNGPPCAAGYVDVKATDAGVPWFLADKVVPAINAHARVSIKQVSTLSGSLPLAVQDVNPTEVAAIFYDEGASNALTSTSAVLATRKLANSGARTLNGKAVVVWDNIASPVGVTVASANTGVVVALSGTASWSLTGSVSTICGQTFVTCYGADGTTGDVNGGLQFIHGYSTGPAGTAAAPKLRDVSLYSGTCTDTSSPDFLLNGNCTVGVRAKVDFGTGVLNPTLPPTSAQLKVARTNGNGCPTSGSSPKGCPMTYNAGTGYWETSTTLPIMAAATGPLPIELNWGTSSGNGTFQQVARPFSAWDGSGPIVYAQVSEAGASAESLVIGTTHSLSVAVGLTGNLSAASSVNDPTVILRFASGAASNSGALDCDAGINSRDEIHYGCRTPYQQNFGQPCPNSASPANCVPTQTGNFTGPLRDGMNDRFTPCPPNNWSVPAGSPAGTLPDIPDGDPRLIPMLITTFNAFAHNGTGLVPVVNFAAFYVTGWDQGNNGPCPAGVNEPFPGAGSGSGDIWGHFVVYIGNFTGATNGTATCNFTNLGLCTTQLTQ